MHATVWPHKKRDQPLGNPKGRRATEAEELLAQELLGKNHAASFTALQGTRNRIGYPCAAPWNTGVDLSHACVINRRLCPREQVDGTVSLRLRCLILHRLANPRFKTLTYRNVPRFASDGTAGQFF